MDFIERYTNLISGGNGFIGVTDAPRDYQEAAALFLVSTMAGRKFYFMSAPETNIYKSATFGSGKILNLWFILIGKSRIARKTVSVNKAKDTLAEISGDLMLPDEFTPPALVKLLAARKRGEACCWINDEISSFFEALRKQDFMTSTDTILSHIYDGKDYRRETISRQTEYIEAPYLTCFLASTDFLPSLFDEGRLRQGFLNRFIFIVGERETWKANRTTLQAKERAEAQELLTWLTALGDMDDSVPVLVNYDSVSRKLFDKFEQEVEKRIMSGMHPLKEGYMGNVPNFVTRLASIYRIAREDLNYFQLTGKQRRPFLTVEKQDLQRAIDYCEKAWNWFEAMLDLMRRPSQSRIPVKEEHVILYIESIIRQKGKVNHNNKYEIDRTGLSREANLSKKELDQTMDLMQQQGRIAVHKRGHGRGPKTTIYELQDVKPAK